MIDTNKKKSLKQQSEPVKPSKPFFTEPEIVSMEHLTDAIETLLDYKVAWGSPILTEEQWTAVADWYELTTGSKYTGEKPGRFSSG